MRNIWKNLSSIANNTTNVMKYFSWVCHNYILVPRIVNVPLLCHLAVIVTPMLPTRIVSVLVVLCVRWRKFSYLKKISQYVCFGTHFLQNSCDLFIILMHRIVCVKLHSRLGVIVIQEILTQIVLVQVDKSVRSVRCT